MKNIHTNTFFVKTALVIAVALAFILPTSAVIVNTQENVEGTHQALFDAAARPCMIKTLKTYDGSGGIALLSDGDDIKISPEWYTSGGDDTNPAITVDDKENIVITWTNYNEDPDIEGDKKGFNIGLTYSADGVDQDAFQQHAIIYESMFTAESVKVPDIFSSDIALIRGPETDDYTGLFGVYLQRDQDGNEYTGFYQIHDVTGDPTKEGYANFSYWVSDPPEATTKVKYAAIADGGYYHQPLSGSGFGVYDGIVDMYVYHFHETLNGHEYDITNCPQYVNYNIRGTSPGGSVFFFDGQGEGSGAPTWCLKTAPATDPDFVLLNNQRFHLTWQYHNVTAGKDQIVWKKVVCTGTVPEDVDIEYTHFQKYIGEGTHPSIAGSNDGKIAIVYMNPDGNVSCAYSGNDGESWTTTKIAIGTYPDICLYKGKFFASYITGGNLYVVNSTDGATWSTPTRINDVDGKVVAEENAVDIHAGGIVWVDSRGTDKDIYYYQLFNREPKPKLVITITPGFALGVNAVIRNNGSAPATNVKWEIKITGGLFGLINKTFNGTISSIAVTEEKPIKSGIVFGLGTITIEVTATCDEYPIWGIPPAVQKGDGTQLFILTSVQ
jgi:hypothetical protein